MNTPVAPSADAHIPSKIKFKKIDKNIKTFPWLSWVRQINKFFNILDINLNFYVNFKIMVMKIYK